MPYDPELHHRRSIRLPHWDYAESGAYFVTLCTFERARLFGAVRDDQMGLNRIGEIVAEEWLRSAEIRSEVELDDFVVMPNHLHAIVFIVRNGSDDGPAGGRPFSGTANRSLSALIQGFKASATKRINQLRRDGGSPVWQRNYYERVLRNDRELGRAREYVLDNPRKWAEDKNNPDAACAVAIALPTPTRTS